MMDEKLRLTSLLEMTETKLNELETDYAEGNQAQIFQSVGERVAARAALLRQKDQYEKELANLEKVSSGVQSYIDAKPPASKFYLDSGEDHIDASLTPYGGKKI